MALRGSIDDVPIADVLQFIHMSGKSGVLSLVSGAGRAWVEFSHGNIVFARSPAVRSLGALLVESGTVDQDSLDAAVRQQAAEPVRPPLGRLLMERGACDQDGLAACVKRQISEAMTDIFDWREGEFEFDQTNVEVLDDTRVDTSDVLPLLNLNTKFLLMEAVRLIDERRRDIEVGLGHVGFEAAEELTDQIDLDTKTSPVALLVDAPAIEPAPTLPPVRGDGGVPEALAAPAEQRAGIILVGFEKGLTPLIFEGLTREGYPVVAHVPIREVDRQLLGQRPWPGSMVVIFRVHVTDDEQHPDLESHVQLVGAIGARHPGWSLITLTTGSDAGVVGRLYAAGVRAALPLESPPDAAGEVQYTSQAAMLRGLVGVLSRIWRENARAARAQASELRVWLQAKRITSDMHQALQRASIALELMRVAAQALDRAILFLVKGKELFGLGAFGLAANGQPMAEAIRGLVLPVGQQSPLSQALSERRAVKGAARELGLGDAFFTVAGSPARDFGVLIPLAGSSRTIGILYGDNGSLDAPVGSLDAIEIAAAHAGIAYENRLLRVMLDAKRGRA